MIAVDGRPGAGSPLARRAVASISPAFGCSAIDVRNVREVAPSEAVTSNCRSVSPSTLAGVVTCAVRLFGVAIATAGPPVYRQE